MKALRPEARGPQPRQAERSRKARIPLVFSEPNAVLRLQRTVGNQAVLRELERRQILRMASPGMLRRARLRWALRGYIDNQDATCQARTAEVVAWLTNDARYHDAGNAVGAVYIAWMQGKEPFDHTAAMVAWDDGQYVVDTTITQFDGYRGLRIYIDRVDRWRATVERAVRSAADDADGFDLRVRSNGPFDEAEMTAMQLRMREGRALEDSGSWHSNSTEEE